MYTFLSKCEGQRKAEAGGEQGGEGGKKQWPMANGQWWHSNLVPLNDNQNDNDNDKMVSFLTFLKLLKWQ